MNEGGSQNRWHTFSGWMALIARLAVGMFGALAVYSLVFDVPWNSMWFNYTMWTLNGIGVLAFVLWLATYRG